MRADIVISDLSHPVYSLLKRWADGIGAVVFQNAAEAPGGDILFLISCTKKVDREIRGRYSKVLVLHESALPIGRGWSPLAWQILQGHNLIPITMLEAADEIDAGDIVKRDFICLEGHELNDEINEKAFRVKAGMMEWAISMFGKWGAEPQVGEISTWPRRGQDNSRIDPDKSIKDQFNLMRICEPRFPAFFDHLGHRYEITIRKSYDPVRSGLFTGTPHKRMEIAA